MEFHYTKEDFSTPGPYEDILSIQNPFQREVATNQLAQYAKSVGVGVTGFKRMMKLYIQSQESDRMVYLDHDGLHRPKAGVGLRRVDLR